MKKGLIGKKVGMTQIFDEAGKVIPVTAIEAGPCVVALELTGSVKKDVSKNIYDLAGNCNEWTIEANSTYLRVLRGGAYSRARPISFRGSTNPNSDTRGSSFRPTLYIK